MVFAALVLAFSVAAGWLSRVYVTAPIVFVVAGAVISAVSPSAGVDAAEGIKVVAELTLALILFHDAAQVRPRQIEADRGLVLRLLLVGLPLTVLFGFLAARLVFPAMPVMVALLLAAALAPTDAGLGAATVLNPVVPVRIRRALNVESGLNDGLITPVVLFAIAAAAGEEGLSAGVSAVQGLFELGVGAAVGSRGRRRRWPAPGLVTPSRPEHPRHQIPWRAGSADSGVLPGGGGRRQQFRGRLRRGNRVHRGGLLG